MNVEAACPVKLNRAVEADWLVLEVTGPDTFELRDTRTGTVLGRIQHASDSPAQVEIFYGKGGYTAIVSGEDGLKYFGLPGSRIAVGGTTVQLNGEPVTGNPDRLPCASRGPVQQHSRQAMILGAGLATRFEPISGQNTGYSKPAVPLAGNRSVIECIANGLTRDGFTHLRVNTYFMPASLKAGLARSQAAEVRYIDEAEPSGTAGGLRKMLLDPQYAGLLDEGRPILVVQGDAVTDACYSDLMEAHVGNNALVTLGCQLVAEKDVSKFGIILTDRSGDDGQSGRITGFQEKPPQAEALSRMANTGFYIFSPKAYPIIREIYQNLLKQAQSKAASEGMPAPGEVLFDFAMDIFPEILRRVEEDPSLGIFWAQVVPGYWSDIGNPQQYLESVHDLYAGRLSGLDLPDAARYYRNGILYWEGAQEAADRQGAVLEGNVIVATPFSAAS